MRDVCLTDDVTMICVDIVGVDIVDQDVCELAWSKNCLPYFKG